MVSPHPKQVENSPPLIFYLNGARVVIPNPDPTMLLIDYLRSPEVALTGTKLACGEGGCAACTVMLSRYDGQRKQVVDIAVNACLRPLCSLAGAQVTTTEGIGSTRGSPHPVQERIAFMNGSQCGYCTPGFVMNMYTLLRNDPQPTQQKVEDNFDGHICRCTGYRPILQAMKSFAVDYPPDGGYQTNHKCEPEPPGHEPSTAGEEPVFPNASVQDAADPGTLKFEAGGYQWFRPVSLAEVQALKREYGSAPGGLKLVAGNTTLSILKTFDPHILIDVAQVPELRTLEADANGVRFGAANTLQEVASFLEATVPRLSPGLGTGLVALRDHLLMIGNLQVRNVGTLTGNIMLTRAQAETSDPFSSDVYTPLVALGGTITFASEQYASGTQAYLLEDLPAPNDLPADAVATTIHIPYTGHGDYVQTYKVASRHQDAHAIVNAGFRVRVDEAGLVRQATLVYGGIGRLPVHARKTEEFLVGESWNEGTLQAALELLSTEVAQELVPFADSQFLPPGYRESVAENLFYRYFLYVAEQLNPRVVGPSNRSGALPYRRPLSTGRQHVETYPGEAPVGEPIINRSAIFQACGEARYTHDIPLPPHGYHASVVLSQQARGSFSYRDGLDAVKANLHAQFPGVKALVTVADVPGDNLQGMGGDEPVFADKEVIYWGQLMALVVASDATEALRAAQWVGTCIEYSPLPNQPAVLSIEAALAEPDGRGLFRDNAAVQHIPDIVRKGSDESWLMNPTYPLDGGALVSGQQRNEAQYQFYMETQACLAVPQEQRAITLYSSTQNPVANQLQAATLLGIPVTDVQVSVRRLGGGFGGKQFRSAFLSSAAALAAWVVNRPVRIALNRNDDMQWTGKRHPLLGAYHVGFTQDGTLTGMKVDLVSDGGCSLDCSFPVMDLMQQHADGAYYVPTFGTTGNVARTNLASNTAMRAFGVIQATLVVEEAIERVAHELGLLPETVREKNMYATAHGKSFQHTHFGQALRYCIVRDIWGKLLRTSSFHERQPAVEEFNKQNRWRKRGISMIPLKYGIGFQPRLLEQGSALVNVYASDGSVYLQHGGVEVGQGLYTKMIQIAAETLGIPMAFIRAGDTLTGTVPNASATAASTGADLNGGAVKKACLQLRRRLERVCMDQKIEGWRDHWSELWPKIVQAAYAARVDLSSQGFYKVKHMDDVEYTHQYGRAFAYFVYAAACSEVEIDVLTGDTTILRTDLLYDAGKSLNPCLDIGQLEGGFVQGVGLMLTEQTMVDAQGSLFSDSTFTYKPPCTKTIPLDFRVALYPSKRRSPVHGKPIDYAAVQSSKGVGEPALVLASSVFFAVKHAILAARRDQGVTDWFEMEAPATVARVQDRCLVSRSSLRLG